MPERRIPASLRWLAALIALSVLAAGAGGLTLYLQARHVAHTQAEAITGGSVTRGEAAIARYGCAGCHVIAGIAGANGSVGPDLTHVSERAHIAGRLANDPSGMARWLMHPQAVQPGGGMPEMGVTAADARDIAAYLYARN
jgi:cytochrome c